MKEWDFDVYSDEVMKLEVHQRLEIKFWSKEGGKDVSSNLNAESFRKDQVYILT